MAMPANAPKSPGSAVPAVSVSGIVTPFGNVPDSRAVTVADPPSSTGLGATDRLTVREGDVSSSVVVTDRLAVSPA